MPEKKKTPKKSVVIKANPAVARAEGLPAKVATGTAQGTITWTGTAQGRSKSVVTELRQDAIIETEYEARDGLRWVETEVREDGQLTDFDLHNSTPDKE